MFREFLDRNIWGISPVFCLNADRAFQCSNMASSGACLAQCEFHNLLSSPFFLPVRAQYCETTGNILNFVFHETSHQVLRVSYFFHSPMLCACINSIIYLRNYIWAANAIPDLETQEDREPRSSHSLKPVQLTGCATEEKGKAGWGVFLK